MCAERQVVEAVEREGNALLSRALGLPQGQQPFPWQTTLLQRLACGELVPALDIPTGLGKTATMAIWLVARALGASVPRRLVYVVDRRAVVDQASETAELLREWLSRETGLSHALGLGARKLPISTLRGQHVDNREWLEDPSLPAIVVGTVDMVGSRLLFSGYGCSRKMWPYHAALLGADALIVLDEAHLVPPFEALVRGVSDTESLKPQRQGVIPGMSVIALSATGRQLERTLALGKRDRAHAEVKRRLDARKRVRIADPVDGSELAGALARRAWELAASGTRNSRLIIFVDSRRTAQEVYDAIGRLAKGDSSTSKIAIERELFVGGRRVVEREVAAQRLDELGLLAGSKYKPDVPVFVIATSAGEVGVDLDAEHAVLDLVEWERMVQRLGRVNRRGQGDAEVWVVPVALDEKTNLALAKDAKIRADRGGDTGSDQVGVNEDDEDETDADDAKPPKKLKEDERARVERWTRRQATERALRSLPFVDGAYDGSPGALDQMRKAEGSAPLIEEASSPPPLHPKLTLPVVQAWSMTSLEEHSGRPRIVPWLRGWIDEEAQTTLVWRSALPRRSDAKAFFEAAPVELPETLERESTDVLAWIGKRVKQGSKSVTSNSAARGAADEAEDAVRQSLLPSDVVMFILDGNHPAWTLEQLNSLDGDGRSELLRKISGKTVVVDVRLGGLDENGLLDPTSDAATDVSEQAPARVSFRVREVADLDVLESGDWRVEDTFVARVNEEGEATAWLVVETDLSRPATTEDGRSTGKAQALHEHEAFAERHVRGIAERVGLDPRYQELLALAALLHDEGKKAERWQRAFRAPKGERPLGKTTSRPIQSILAGYRHELGSLPFAEQDSRIAKLSPEDRDLVLHLIAAHHGFARPMLRTDGCDDAPPSALVVRARTIAMRFARLEKQWGPWGLAWLETLLRAADQNASRENDERGKKNG